MEGYRYQQLAYLIIPILLGTDFFKTARVVRSRAAKETAWTVIMEGLGYAFIVLLPALFLFTIISIEYRHLPLFTALLHRFDRYCVMFFFLGSWWQVFLLTALRARRVADGEKHVRATIWVPYLLCGAFISGLILWAAPWNLMWVSVFWFVASCGIFLVLDTPPLKIYKTFLVLAIVGLIVENILFMALDAIV